ncbi:N-formylglutamate amidohydrolase [Rosistilla oblonga]|uniref:N-formylglutamate amidohydrolase n=1 Tax=Rosistilla oblonga TaxID=2527990 RepID=UPI003A977A07
MELILTCEHATNHIPSQFEHLFVDARSVLQGHRGWDPGTLALGRMLQRRFSAVLFRTTVSRLLVEVNRSANHRQLFSQYSRSLDQRDKAAVLQRYYWPYRQRIEEWIEDRVAAALPVLHLSLHSFVPKLDGQVRTAELGLLYDPRRPAEKAFCDRWRDALKISRPDLRTRRNYPYLGRSDGLTTALRQRFPDPYYIGIEVEVNQALVGPASGWQQLKRDLAATLQATLEKS